MESGVTMVTCLPCAIRYSAASTACAFEPTIVTSLPISAVRESGRGITFVPVVSESQGVANPTNGYDGRIGFLIGDRTSASTSVPVTTSTPATSS